MKKKIKLNFIQLAIIVSIPTLIMSIIMVASSLSGCNFAKKQGATRTIVDITGAEVEIPAEVDEVVNLFSFGCQMMIGLGLGDYLVGISDATFETQWLELMYPTAKDIPSNVTAYKAGPSYDFYYEGNFSDNMPEFNCDSPAVREEFQNIINCTDKHIPKRI